MHKISAFIVSFFILCTCNLHAAIIKTVLGDIQEHNPSILALLDSQALLRLKHIDQSGPQAYFCANFPSFTRYDHSLGVYALLKRYNVSQEEQIAGLLHDASHTVFSHVADIVFQSGTQRTESYQDVIHPWFLQSMHVDKILAKYHLTITDILPKNPKFTGLEQPYPDMNADRIEYNLHTGLVLNDLNLQEIEQILNALHFESDKWFFSDIASAKKFAKLSNYYTKAFWGGPENVAMYTVTSAAIKYALQNNIISKKDMHFGNDRLVVDKLTASNDPIMRSLCTILFNINRHFVVTNDTNPDVFQPVKMRGIDPLVLHDHKLQRLSELSFDFKRDLYLTASYAKKGVRIKFINIDDATILQLLRTANT